jgi:hypothetical protein
MPQANGKTPQLKSIIIREMGLVVQDNKVGAPACSRLSAGFFAKAEYNSALQGASR